MLTLEDVERAADRLAGVAHVTPVITSRTLDAQVGGKVLLKAECFQRTGSFKFRGAYNAIAALDATERAQGIVTGSSGNHAQAVALAAALHDVAATIVMPGDAPAAKVAATRNYGGEIITYDRYRESRDEVTQAVATQTGAVYVAPFDNWDVMAGQGTAAAELFEVVDGLDTVVCCVGGGGLISGWSTVAKAAGRGDQVTVIGVEPEAGDDVKRSLRAGRIIEVPVPDTIADGQQTTAPGERTLAVILNRVDEIVTVTDPEIIAAMRFAFERLNIVLEPSGASALAAVLAGHVDTQGQRIGVSLSGGNINPARFAALVAHE